LKFVHSGSRQVKGAALSQSTLSVFGRVFQKEDGTQIFRFVPRRNAAVSGSPSAKRKAAESSRSFSIFILYHRKVFDPVVFKFGDVFVHAGGSSVKSSGSVSSRCISAGEFLGENIKKHGVFIIGDRLMDAPFQSLDGKT
jgi:hypothetical protein